MCLDNVTLLAIKDKKGQIITITYISDKPDQIISITYISDNPDQIITITYISISLLVNNFSHFWDRPVPFFLALWDFLFLH